MLAFVVFLYTCTYIPLSYIWYIAINLYRIEVSSFLSRCAVFILSTPLPRSWSSIPMSGRVGPALMGVKPGCRMPYEMQLICVGFQATIEGQMRVVTI